MEVSVRPRNAPIFRTDQSEKHSDSIPTSSPAFATPTNPTRFTRPQEVSKSTVLPILLPPATLRPLAFRTFTKKHNLTLTSSALQVLATFIGKHCGSGWREEGLAEKVLDDVAKSWKKNGGGVIVPGEAEDLKNILQNIEQSMTGRKASVQKELHRQGSFSSRRLIEDGANAGEIDQVTAPAVGRTDGSMSPGVSVLDNESEETSDTRDIRNWLKVVGAFDQPRLTYNVIQKHFEAAGNTPSFLPDPSQKTQLFRSRYNLIYQRLLRNESFQTSSVAAARTGTLQRSSSALVNAEQAYKITPIANLLGRSGSSRLLLGILTVSPVGLLTLNDLSGSITLDVQHARPVPEDGAWFTPGMIVLVDGLYEEGSDLGPGLDGNRGVGGTIGGKFIAFSLGGPPCERREITLGVIGSSTDGTLGGGGGFGWVDFLGVGSERAAGPAMRSMESKVLKKSLGESPQEGRTKMVILGEVVLDNAQSLQALKKILGMYASEKADQAPMVFVVMGSFVHHAVMAGGGSGGSIEYKEYLDSIASALSEYPTILQNATFVFVPGDNDPWASAFSAGAATTLPRPSVPDLFVSRIKRAFAAANAEAEKATGKKTDGEAVWTTNPSRLTLFGPSHEVVLFRDNLSGRLRRNAVRFRPIGTNLSQNEGELDGSSSRVESNALGDTQSSTQDVSVDFAVEAAESHIPAPKAQEPASSALSSDLHIARKLVKTMLDQGYLSPFPLSNRPVLWDYAGALHLYPLPTALVLMDAEAPPFTVTYEGCHVMNPGTLIPHSKRGIAQWMEYDIRTKRGKTREARF